jgi:hypothetical protein
MGRELIHPPAEHPRQRALRREKEITGKETNAFKPPIRMFILLKAFFVFV